MIPFVLAAVMAVSGPSSAWAASLSDYDEAAQERLKDNVMEYGELQALISVYNPQMQSANDAVQSALNDLNTTIIDMETNIGKLNSTAEDMKEAGNMIGYQTYKQTAKAMRDQVLKNMKEGMEDATSYTGTKDLRTLEYSLTSVAQMLMISYESASAQRDVAAKAKELSEAAHQSVQTQMSLGMATEADLLSAQKNVEQAVNGLAQIDAILLNLRQNLCLMTGWSYDAVPEIRTVPGVNQEIINAMNPETDKEKAIGNNITLIQQRSGSFSGSTVKKRDSRSRSISESEQQLRIQIEQLYQTVLQKKTELDAANSAYAGAETAKQAADAKYRMGMLGKPEYLQEEVSFLTQKAAKTAAEMALLQAVNDYEWGVKGLASIQ